MNDAQTNEILMNAKNILTIEPESAKIDDLGGYQVTKAELFAHTREPAITVWYTKVKFNMACIRKFPGVSHVQFLINTDQKRLIIRPCDPDAPDSLRWARGIGGNAFENRDLNCKIFAAKLFDLMGWNNENRYKILGNTATYKNETLFLFKLSDFEVFINDGKKSKSYLPEDWREYFGVPVEKHEESYKIDLADGYITTNSI